MTLSATAGPKVVVLMATYNGREWLPEQVATILDQSGVDVELVVSDDGSADGSWQWLQELAAREPRVRLLPREGTAGGVGANFFRLLAALPADSSALVAFSDQDDRWLPGKLAAQAHALADGRLAGVSGNVTAFYPDGRRQLIRKDDPQRRFDHLFESAGPGCTFLLSSRLVALVRAQLADPSLPAGRAELHDWLTYVLCRSVGWQWEIENAAWVDYRQHAGNVLGANVGWRAALDRLRRIEGGWHREQVTVMAEVAARLTTDPAERAAVEKVLLALRDRGPRARWWLARHAGWFRRRRRDRWALAALILLGRW